jgi:hypothetical protein
MRQVPERSVRLAVSRPIEGIVPDEANDVSELIAIACPDQAAATRALATTSLKGRAKGWRALSQAERSA